MKNDLEISTYYRIAALLPLCGSLITSTALGIYDLTYINSFVWWELTIAFVLLLSTVSVIVSVLSCSIFLMEFSFIRRKRVLVCLSWFLLPGIILIIIAKGQIMAIINDAYSLFEVGLLSILLVHSTGLILSFSKFSRNLVVPDHQEINKY